MAKATVQGFQGLQRALREVAKHPTPAERKRARRVALQPIVDEARETLIANGSVESGKLSKALGVADENADLSTAGPVRGKPHANVAHLVEFGTAPHFQPNRFGGIMHPGARPKPFLRPAFETMKEEVVRKTAEEVLKDIAKAVDRVGVRRSR